MVRVAVSRPHFFQRLAARGWMLAAGCSAARAQLPAVVRQNIASSQIQATSLVFLVPTPAIKRRARCGGRGLTFAALPFAFGSFADHFVEASLRHGHRRDPQAESVAYPHSLTYRDHVSAYLQR